MTTVIVPVYRYLNKKIKGLLNITKIARDRNLNFSANDHIAGNVIALDPERKKLVHSRNTIKTSSLIIIDLNDVEGCSVQKHYNQINAGDLKRKKISDFIKSIYLNLRFKNQGKILSLALYENGMRTNEDIQGIEAKANHWHDKISKLLHVQPLTA